MTGTSSFWPEIQHWQLCCDICKIQAFQNPPCVGWVYTEATKDLPSSCVIQYSSDKNTPITMIPGSVGKSAGLINMKRKTKKLIFFLFEKVETVIEYRNEIFSKLAATLFYSEKGLH